MKKYFIYLAAASAALAVLLSCTREEDRPETDNVDTTTQEQTIPQGDGHFSLTLSAPVTKTEFGAKEGSTYPKHWKVGDQICVNGVVSDALTAGDIDVTPTSATFHFGSDISAASYQVVYPAAAYNSLTGKVTIPATQAYVAGNFDPDSDIILGYGTDPAAITLANAVSYLKVKLTQGDYGNFGVSSVALTCSGKKLNGEFEIAGSGLACCR